MKKVIFVSLLVLVVFSIKSCKKIEKKEAKQAEKSYSVDSESTVISWIAYKTTSKVPVKGQFSKLNVENSGKASSATEALDGLKFSIPINSLFTNDSIRDGKLKEFFFGTLKNTNLISGTIKMIDERTGTANITMNGISHELPISCTVIDNKTVNMEALLDLDDWKAQAAIKALNDVCKELHTGPDGVTKTWSDVKINVAVNLQYN